MNKPPGCITGHSDPEGRPLVYEHIPAQFPRLPHVGRLDFNTEGLLLFTDDGRLARALLDPGAARIRKVYEVKVRPVLAPDDARIASLAEPLADTAPAQARWLRDRTRASWVEVVLHEGKHHQVRRLCERAGLQIVKLRRVALGPLALGELALRWCRPLSEDEVRALYAAALPGELPP